MSIDAAADVEAERPADTDNCLEKVLALPQKYKAAIYLYCYEGYSTEEIARILKKNRSTVRGYLHRGRKLLKMEMEGDIA